MKAKLFCGVAAAFLFAACNRSPALSASEQSFSLYQVDSLTTRFLLEDVEVQLAPDIAFFLRGYCPKIRKAQFTPEIGGSMGTLQIWGEDLDRVWGVVGRGAGGEMGQSKPKTAPDGSLRLALGCRDCQVVLGMEVDGQRVGCLGPGHSLELKQGRLVY